MIYSTSSIIELCDNVTPEYNSYEKMVYLHGTKMTLELYYNIDNVRSSTSAVNSTPTGLYTLGWNLICGQYGDTTNKIYGFPNYSQTPTTFSFNLPGMYTSSPNFRAVIGSDTTDVNSYTFKGVIHRAYFKSGYLTENEIKSQFIQPKGSNPTLCMYFIGSFPNMGTSQDANREFKNLLKNNDGQNLVLTNTDSASLSADGPVLASGQKLTLTNIKVTAMRAVGLQFWFKGSFQDNTELVKIKTPSGGKPVYLIREGSHVIIRNSYATTTIANLTSANDNLDSTKWTYYALNLYWVANSNDFNA
mmetsp:Transcript_10922/g.12274  ORF Transcript_10922/g.12274 Transcript_10922/m.12274 type:complete len:304 (-) Transcript_10922:487-1398(-)